MPERPRETTYMAECFWPDVRRGVVESAAQRIRLSTAELALSGAAVELTGTILLPDDDVVFYLFHGESAAAVSEACERADVRFERVLEAVELEQSIEG